MRQVTSDDPSASNRRPSGLLDMAIITYAALLAILGAFYFYGQGLVLESSAIGDEEFIFCNALAVAYNGLGYRLESMWYGYWHYSPLLAFFIAAVLRLYAFMAQLSPDVWRANVDQLLVVARMVNVALFVGSLFALRSALRISCPQHRSLPTLGLLLYVSILGPVAVANVVRAEGAIVAATVFFIWSLVRYGPNPSRPGWLAISILAAVPIGIEVYGAVVVGSCMLFFIAGDRIRAWKMRRSTPTFIAKTAALVVSVTGLIVILASLLNVRMALDPWRQYEKLRAAAEMAQDRQWEISVLIGYGPENSLLVILVLLFEWTFPILLAALIHQSVTGLSTRACRWWLPAAWLPLAFWHYKYSTSAGGTYLFLPAIPLLVLVMMDFLAANRRVFAYIAACLCLVGLGRVTILQVAKCFTSTYASALQFIADDSTEGESSSIYAFSLEAARHIGQDARDLAVREHYDYYYNSLPPPAYPANALQVSDSWRIDSGSDVHWGRDIANGMARIQAKLNSDLSEYDYVLFDERYAWDTNPYAGRRNPGLSELWGKLTFRLKDDREKVYETGGVDPRFLFQMSRQVPPWTTHVLAELLDWYRNRDARDSPFGPLVTVYARP